MRGVTILYDNLTVIINISIHTPHAGSDKWGTDTTRALQKFQSTLPMRGVTGWFVLASLIINISIHTPHAGSDGGVIWIISLRLGISIHTPHAGSDT